MTQQNRKSGYGLPAPITKLTVEQDLKMRILKDKLNENYDSHKEDIITIFLALQKQNFVLGNSLKNLLEKWNTIEEDRSNAGILFGIRIWTST